MQSDCVCKNETFRVIDGFEEFEGKQCLRCHREYYRESYRNDGDYIIFKNRWDLPLEPNPVSKIDPNHGRLNDVSVTFSSWKDDKIVPERAHLIFHLLPPGDFYLTLNILGKHKVEKLTAKKNGARLSILKSWQRFTKKCTHFVNIKLSFITFLPFLGADKMKYQLLSNLQ